MIDFASPQADAPAGGVEPRQDARMAAIVLDMNGQRFGATVDSVADITAFDRDQAGPVPAVEGAIDTVRFGRREVSIARREVRVDGQLRALQPRPFDLLAFLIENRERVVCTDELLDRIWQDEIVQPGSLAAAIMRVRKALLESDQEPAGSIIRTYQRVGYRFVATLDGETPD